VLPLYLQVKLVAEERDGNISRVGELESQVAELKNAAGRLFTNLSHFSLLYYVDEYLSILG